MSISINNIGQSMAMDGQNNATVSKFYKSRTSSGYRPPENVNTEAAEVAEDFAKDYKKIERQISQIQKISDLIGRKLEFSINEKLNEIIVKVVDPSTKQVIKEIPSAEIQNLQMRLRENINFLVDEKV
ncbi:MAG: flagellar protein FlaG [Treponemataceae bacterium]